MANLLDRSSLVLTPTAFNNGEALCIKPDDGSGDFQFSRNSAATRVNAQGLVENVQILSSNLVQNGDFSNGSTDWNLGTGWSIGEDKAVADGTTNNAISQTIISSVVGKLYKIDFTIDDYVTGNIRIYFGGVFTPFVNANGVYSFYISATAIDALATSASGLFIGSITNISVIEITDDTNLPRINYENGCGSWLFEPQSTNLVTYSEDFSQYSTGNSPIIEGGFLAPDGTNNAYKITNTGSSTLYISGANFTSAATRSVYARSVSGTGTATLMSYFGNTNNVFTLTEDWQRFEVNGTTAAAGEDNFYAADFRGSGTLTEYIIWGAQVEEQPYATSYIPTSGSTVTRNQDVCTNGGSLATINSTEGVLYAEIAALANDLTDRDISISDGTNNNVVRIRLSRFSNNIGYAVLSNGITTVGALVSGQTQTNTNKIAVKYKQDDFALWINGVEVATDTSGSTPIGLSSLQFTSGNVALPFFGKTKALAVWKEALSDSELQSLTTI